MKKFISIAIVLLYSSACSNTALACGPDWIGYNYTYLLEHYGFNHEYYRLQLDPYYADYGNTWMREDTPTAPPKNCYVDEWMKYLQLDTKLQADMQTVLYNSSSKTMKAANNNITAAIKKKSNSADILNYFELLDEYQRACLPNENVWDYEHHSSVIDSNIIVAFTKKCNALMAQSQEPFIQWRAFYLALRANYFNRYFGNTITLFEKNYKLIKHDNSLAQFWCEGIASGVYFRTKQDSKSIYFAARQFMHCPNQAIDASHTYRWSSRDWKAALPLCTTALDTAAVAIVHASSSSFPELEAIQYMHRADASHQIIKLLWLRETAKIEMFLLNTMNADNFFISRYDGETDTNINLTAAFSQRDYIAQYMQLGQAILNSKCHESTRVTVANMMAYIYYRGKKYEQAKQLLQQISTAKKDVVELQQTKLLAALIDVHSSKNDEALKNIFQVFDFCNSTEAYDEGLINYIVYNDLAPFYLQSKDTTTALWLYIYNASDSANAYTLYNDNGSPEAYNSSGNMATYLLLHQFTVAQVAAQKTFYLAHKKDNSALGYIMRKCFLAYNEKCFDKIIATKYMHQQRWKEALAIFKGSPELLLEHNGLNPANLWIDDYVDYSEPDKKSAKTTPMQMIELAAALKDKADAGGAASARDNLLYATMLYNFSFYGKDHFLIDDHWRHYMSSTPYYRTDSVRLHFYTNDENFDYLRMSKDLSNYFYLTDCEYYAKRAAQWSSSKDDKAQAYYLLARSYQKRCPTKYKLEGDKDYSYVANVADYYKYSLHNPYFAQLKKEGSGTKIHQSIFNTCSYYRDFCMVKK